MINEVKVKNTPVVQDVPIVQEKPVIKDILSKDIIKPEEPVKEVKLEPKLEPELPQITSRTASVINLSGRTSGVWKDSWYLFLKNPLFGFGAQADRYFLNGQHAHNTVIHAMLQAGILGTIAMILAFVWHLFYLVKLFINPLIQTKDKQFLITITAVLIFFIVRGLTESLVFFSADWLFVAPIIVYIQCLYNELNSKKINEGNILEFRGSKINIIEMPEVLQVMQNWIKNERQKLHWIIVTGMHGIAEANKNKEFKKILSLADLWVPDGISLIWLARLKGLSAKERISGADLMKDFFIASQKDNFNNYFYGDTPETLNLLSKKIKENFPRLKVAGYFSPPFKVLSEREEQEIIDKINNAKPDILWVALGLPKQERWIYKNREKLKVPVVVGVGAAFKFLSGSVKRAPKWVGSMGLEWLWRLVFEFKTTWKRVFVAGPYFLWLVILDLVSTKRYK
jgi:N-acetylglucosaminyldiphosphoundecaprenol N-acetyl-beta-D-mannosaminyltransferase